MRNAGYVKARCDIVFRFNMSSGGFNMSYGTGLINYYQNQPVIGIECDFFHFGHAKIPLCKL